MEIVRKWIHEDTPQSRGSQGSFALRIFNSPLSEEITSHRFLKKFVIPSFKCYTRVTDPVQHIQAYQLKMAVHPHDDCLMCRVFPSSLKGIGLGLVLLSPIALETSSTTSHHDLSTASRRLAMPSSINTLCGRSLRRTSTTSSPSR